MSTASWDWPADNLRPHIGPEGFVVLVAFSAIADPETAPKCWVMPADVAMAFVETVGTRRIIRARRIKEEASEYYQAWGLVLGTPQLAEELKKLEPTNGVFTKSRAKGRRRW